MKGACDSSHAPVWRDSLVLLAGPVPSVGRRAVAPRGRRARRALDGMTFSERSLRS
ncbi:MAG: hypothetical protein ACI8W7_001566 [Gammaproteobacteria bacterium]|jgi:hypothetical protein